MSLLPVGRSLSQALPDLDVLLADPLGYLTEAPLALGARRMYGLAGLFAVPGVGLLASCYFAELDPERLSLGAGLLLGAGVWAGWSMFLRGHELVLHPTGVEVIYGNSVVWAPWALFNASGQPFVPDSDNPAAGLTLPVNPLAIGFIELRRDGFVVARGAEVFAPQWSLRNREEVVLPGRYEIAASDIGELLLVLGNRLGRELPPGPLLYHEDPPPKEELSEEALADWFTIPLTRMRLPHCCSRCGGAQEDILPLRVSAAGDWLLALVMGVRSMEIPVPVCEPCRDGILARQRAGLTLGVIVGALLGLVGGAMLGGWLSDGEATVQATGAVLGLGIGGLVGTLLGGWWSRRLPVQVRRYSPSRGLVQVRCMNPMIARRIREGNSKPGA